MDGLVVGSQIQCHSPAAKEVPRIITENGEWSPEAKRGGKSFSRRLDDENSGQTRGIEGAHRRGGSEEAACIGRGVTGRGGWSVPPLPLELKPGEHPRVSLTLGGERCQEGGRGERPAQWQSVPVQFRGHAGA